MKKEQIITEPRVYLIGRQSVDEKMLKGFLDDEGLYFETDTEVPAEIIAETAGRTCYMSFGKGRKTNADYLERIISSHHGSVLEHATWNFLVTGVSRSLTHELIRHRAGWAYCLSGETLIYSEHHDGKNSDGTPKKNGTKKRRLEDLYRMKETHHGRSRMKLLKLRCLDEGDGTFTTGKVKDVVCSGMKPVFHVELEDGKTITCTKHHRFLTPKGWLPLQEITDGLEVSRNNLAVYGNLNMPIMVNGIEAHKDKDWLIKNYHERSLSHEEMASLAGVSKHTIRSWIRKHRIQKPLGSWTIGREPWNKGKRYNGGWHHREETRRLFAEQKRGASNPRWKGGITRRAVAIRRDINTLKRDVFERDLYRCRLCERTSSELTVHHIIPIWAAPTLAAEITNLVTLCKPCHRTINGKEFDYINAFGGEQCFYAILPERKSVGAHLMIPRSRRIVRILYAGEQMTYDIEMDGPNHNFVANGIITHNSQLSQRYVDESQARYVLPPLYREHPKLAEKWLAAIDAAHEAYLDLVESTEPVVAETNPELSPTERRKLVRQSSRAVLPNSCETKIFISANARALRHFFEMRGSIHADAEIRELAIAMARLIKEEAPNMFADVDILVKDGVEEISVKHSKV